MMSGTSMDGADAVLADCARRPRIIAHQSHPYPPALRESLHALQQSGRARLDAALDAHVRLGEWYAGVAQGLIASAGLTARQVRGIGCHGQTVRHGPDAHPGRTLQIGDLARVAVRTGIPTVGDFRSADVAAGGQGAPLAPLFHPVLFGDGPPTVVVNLGGIANITVITGAIALPTGFDTGPGNTLLDGWAQRCTGRPFDAGGAFAAGGQVHAPLLMRLLEHPYFQRPGPKSTGRDEFCLQWVDEVIAGLPDTPPAPDVQATLAELTARTVAAAVRASAPAVKRVVLCGGGVCNLDLVARITRALPEMEVLGCDRLGVAPTAVEALMMAWLAHARLRRRRLTLGRITGSAGARPLGCVYLP